MGVKTTVEIADALLREAKVAAGANGITLRDLIESGLRRELDARTQTARPFRLRDASYRGPSGAIAGVRYDDARALRAYAHMTASQSLDEIHDSLDEPTKQIEAKGTATGKAKGKNR